MGKTYICVQEFDTSSIRFNRSRGKNVKLNKGMFIHRIQNMKVLFNYLLSLIPSTDTGSHRFTQVRRENQILLTIQWLQKISLERRIKYENQTSSEYSRHCLIRNISVIVA